MSVRRLHVLGSVWSCRGLPVSQNQQRNRPGTAPAAVDLRRHDRSLVSPCWGRRGKKADIKRAFARYVTWATSKTDKEKEAKKEAKTGADFVPP